MVHMLDCDIIITEIQIQSFCNAPFRSNIPGEKYDPTYNPI